MRAVQDMYEAREMVVRCVVRLTDGFEVGVGLYLGSNFVCYANLMARLTDEVRRLHGS